MTEHIRFLLNSNIRIVIYNGDLDTVCDFLCAQWFINDLGVPSTSDYEPWYYGEFVVGGMARTYQQGLTFLTILGAGHMAPADKPEATFHMLSRFVLEQES